MKSELKSLKVLRHEVQMKKVYATINNIKNNLLEPDRMKKKSSLTNSILKEIIGDGKRKVILKNTTE